MKKILPYIFILIILAGLFSPIVEVKASQANPNEPCVVQYFGSPTPVVTNAPCKDASGTAQTTATPAAEVAAAAAENPSPSTNDPFKDEINNGCSYKPTSWFSGCLLLVIYYTYFQLPSLILWMVAQF